MSNEVVLAGHVCIDANVSEGSSYTSWGSALMYMERYFSGEQPDVEPVLIAPYGRDFVKYAGGLTLLPEPHGDKTLIFKNYSKEGQRLQECQNADVTQPPPLTDEVTARLKQADIICLAPLLPNFPADYVKRLLSYRQKTAKTVLLPQGYLRTVEADGRISTGDFEEADKILPLFDMVVLSEDDHPDSSNLTHQWAALAPDARIVVTRGSTGASWVEADHDHLVKTEPVPEERIVDTVGCGDTFAAAAMYEYWRGGDILKAIKAGNTAGRAKLFQTPY